MIQFCPISQKEASDIPYTFELLMFLYSTNYCVLFFQAKSYA